MNGKDLSKYRRKYQAFRHHAWAGLGFITVFVALGIVVPKVSEMLPPILFILIIYVIVALLFTYRYRIGLSAGEETVQAQPSVELEKEKIRSDVEKERLKLEKKKAKTEAKKAKKSK